MKCHNCGRAMPDPEAVSPYVNDPDFPPAPLDIDGVLFCFRRSCVKDYNIIRYGMPDGVVL